MDRIVVPEQPRPHHAARERPHADHRSLRDTVDAQLAPITAFVDRVAGRLAPPVNVAGARDRVREGHTAFDPRILIAFAGDLGVPFREAVDTLEHVGFLSGCTAAGARARADSAYTLLISWATGELRSYDHVTAASRYAASLVGRAVLCHASAALRQGEPRIRGWPLAHCPCCGGAPDLAFQTGTARRALVCVRCDTVWDSDLAGCLGCGQTSAPSVVRIPIADELGYTLVVCHSCSRYIKEGPAVPAARLAVERALLEPVDAAAKCRGLRF